MLGSPSIVFNDPTADLQAAINSLGTRGGTIYLGAGTFSQSVTLSTTDNTPIHLIGAGRGVTVLDWTAMGGTPNNDCLKVQGPFSSVESLTVVGVGNVGACTNRGIVVGSSTADIQRVSLVDVEVRATYREALYFEGTTDRGHITFLDDVERCHLRLNIAAGTTGTSMVHIGVGCVGINFNESSLSEFMGSALTAYCGLAGDSVKLERCLFDAPADNTNTWIVFSNTFAPHVVGCRFENTTGRTTPYKIATLNGCTGLVVRDCTLISGAGGSNSKFIAVGQGGAGYVDTGASIVNCWVDGIGAPAAETTHIVFGGGGETVSKHVLAGGGLRDNTVVPGRTVYPWSGNPYYTDTPGTITYREVA